MIPSQEVKADYTTIPSTRDGGKKFATLLAEATAENVNTWYPLLNSTTMRESRGPSDEFFWAFLENGGVDHATRLCDLKLLESLQDPRPEHRRAVPLVSYTRAQLLEVCRMSFCMERAIKMADKTVKRAVLPQWFDLLRDSQLMTTVPHMVRTLPELILNWITWKPWGTAELGMLKLATEEKHDAAAADDGAGAGTRVPPSLDEPGRTWVQTIGQLLKNVACKAKLEALDVTSIGNLTKVLLLFLGGQKRHQLIRETLARIDIKQRTTHMLPWDFGDDCKIRDAVARQLIGDGLLEKYLPACVELILSNTYFKQNPPEECGHPWLTINSCIAIAKDILFAPMLCIQHLYPIWCKLLQSCCQYDRSYNQEWIMDEKAFMALHHGSCIDLKHHPSLLASYIDMTYGVNHGSDMVIQINQRFCHRRGCKNREQRGQPKFQRCSRCRVVHYCSIDCQKKHWTDHKRVCAEPTKPE